MKKSSTSPLNSRTTTSSATATRYCAVYTRKSSEEGLEQSFNSLDAQREACEAYVLSQKAEGWVVLPKTYDDGGFSGGNIERPGLQQLMSDIVAKKVHIIVVYKVDRLTRSLADFAKLVELFDAYGVSFVSITQQFNTTTSMGRLTLNVLLSFAQFEREVTGERIRDKIAASKAKGMWMGGMPPVGYGIKDKTLIIEEHSAQMIRDIYQLYLTLGNVRLLKVELDKRGWLTPARISKRQGHSGGRPFCRGHLYRILSNPIYTGKVAYKDNIYTGQHTAIIKDALWSEVQAKLASNYHHHHLRVSSKSPGLLAGLLFDDEGERLTSVQSNKLNRRYHYYVSQRIIREGKAQAPDALRLPGQALEEIVITRLHHLLTSRTELFGWLNAHGLKDVHAIEAVLSTAASVADVFKNDSSATQTSDLISPLQNLTERIVVRAHEVEITLKLGGLIEEAKVVSHAPASAWECCDWVRLRYQVLLPIQIKRSGLKVLMIVQSPDYQPKGNVDTRLVKLLSRAHQWFNQLSTGRVRSVKELGEQEKLSASHVSRVILVAFLSPDIVRDILDGKHPPSLTSDKLMRSLPLPINWSEQKQALGYR
jgi:site-specific DNA recombinase